ncbi:methyltransferase small [Flavobacteriales bacterium ALC-1]|nr:methyltransferase small [Flavobacteriales bacterium ALC-1]
MIRQLLKKLTHPFLKYGTQKYFLKPRAYVYEGIEVMVMPDVFPPHYTLSTKILLDYIKHLELKDKTLLELGCGSGIVALYAAKKGAQVTASDINPSALNALKEASLKNNITLDIINSDLFDVITNPSYDYIFINPPYYPKAPNNIKEQAWFCGENFEYFDSLFIQLAERQDKTILMILSQDCEIDKIKNMALKNHLQLDIELERTRFAERNYIFKIRRL